MTKRSRAVRPEVSGAGVAGDEGQAPDRPMPPAAAPDHPRPYTRAR
jgi:hypothetical protein